MKLLIVTQIVDTNDPVLGFFHRWIEEFAKHAELVTVICLKEGNHALPENVRVFSLGKDKRAQSKITYALRFLVLCWKLRKDYDSVFVHMNHEYLLIAGWLWFLARKRVGLWYVHKHVSSTLRLSMPFTSFVFTASRESFRLLTSKLRIMGHGIETTVFSKGVRPEIFTVLSIGRLSPTKRVEVLIKAAQQLEAEGHPLHLRIIGGPVSFQDERYAETIRAQAGSAISVEPPVSHNNVPGILASAHAFVNASETGSLDKAVLEAMAARCVPVTSNPAFGPMLEPLGLMAEGTAEGFAHVLRKLVTDTRWRESCEEAVKDEVERRHELSSLIKSIMDTYSSTYVRN